MKSGGRCRRLPFRRNDDRNQLVVHSTEDIRPVWTAFECWLASSCSSSNNTLWTLASTSLAVLRKPFSRWSDQLYASIVGSMLMLVVLYYWFSVPNLPAFTQNNYSKKKKTFLLEDSNFSDSDLHNLCVQHVWDVWNRETMCFKYIFRCVCTFVVLLSIKCSIFADLFPHFENGCR